MTGYFTSPDVEFTFWKEEADPSWRSPQVGALGALMSHWATSPQIPALVTMPTGSGKSAVAVAAGFLSGATRVLVIVPSTELRRQLAEAFREAAVLQRIGALTQSRGAQVVEVTGRPQDWSALKGADVVVALPNSISPVHHDEDPPPRDLFDLVVIDEAHHSPAKTWQAVLEHFEAKFLLLTATPHRADGKRIPGNHIFHYPMRKALDEKIFKPVEACVVPLPAGTPESKASTDELIAAQVLAYFNDPVHTNSTLMVRASTRSRAKDLADRYTALGVPTTLLHAGLGASKQQTIINNLRNGTVRSVAVVGMLIEGFDLPSLRLVAYHDKHKSLPITAQLIGRLARVDSNYPQPSVLITANDGDVYPELQGTLRKLYSEDSDWAQILPGIIDEEIATANANRKFVTSNFAQIPPELALEAVCPLHRAIIWEVPTDSPLPPAFGLEEVPDIFRVGQTFRGQTVLYSALYEVERSTTLLMVTSAPVRPRWHNATGLDSRDYGLHIVSVLEPALSGLPPLLLVNSDDKKVARCLLEELDPGTVRRSADPTRLQHAFDALERTSVSSVGVRNSYAGTSGTPSYKNFLGKGVDRGLRQADTAHSALGHAMVQVTEDGATFTAGLATGKSKYWESRYSPLKTYFEFVSDLADRYWSMPTPSVVGQLLPSVGRGVRLEQWPNADPVAVEIDAQLFGKGWQVKGNHSLDVIELKASKAIPGTGDTLDLLPIEARHEGLLWRAHIDTFGKVHAKDDDLSVSRGFSDHGSLSEFLTDHPLTVFFSNGATTHGTSLVDSRLNHGELTLSRIDAIDWTGVDCGAETDRSAKNRNQGESVHSRVETFLLDREKRRSNRWLLFNDGSGEIADYVLIEADLKLTDGVLSEVDVQSVVVELWHAKASGGGQPALRVTDLEHVLAQAIKSRRWITDPGLWREIGARLHGERSPKAILKSGDEESLDAICGRTDDPYAFTRSRPVVLTGGVHVVQPGVSKAQLLSDLWQTDAAALQSRDLLNVYSDSVSQVANALLLCSE